MKKKITAVFLTLCLVLGLLPLTAMAETWTLDFGSKTYTLKKNGSGYQVDGAGENDADKLYYYTFYRGTGSDSDKFTYYTISGFGQYDGKTQYPIPGSGSTSFTNAKFVSYEITLKEQGGTWGAGAVTKVETNDQGKLEKLPDAPTAPEGKEFDGWYDATSSGEKITVDYQFKEDSTIYAYWKDAEEESKTYTVTLNLNDKDARLPAGTAATLTTGKDGTLESLPTPTLKGSAFNGWYDAAKGGNKVTSKTVFTKDATIYAQWEKVTEIEAVTEKQTEGDVIVAVSAVKVDKGWAKDKNNGTTVFIDAVSTNGGADAVKVEIDSDSMQELAKLAKSSVRIDTDRGRFVLKPADVKRLADLGDIVLEIGKTGGAPSGLTPPKNSKNAEFNGSVVVSLTDGKNTLSVKGLGITVYVKADLTVASGKKAAVWYNDNGSLEKQDGAHYDGEFIYWTVKHS